MTATDSTRASIAAAAAGLPFDDTSDFDDARRGFVARATERQVLSDEGRVVWDLDAYRFLDSAVPDTAHPSLWRQGQLLTLDGLFEVTAGVYQLRGYDLSVMSVIEGETGIIVVDPLISCETAAAALRLYREHRGERPVVAVLYTHSHADHFGGVEGVVTPDDVAAGRVAVIAPEGFMEHAVAENVFAGTAMTRRAGYMYGAALEKGPAGQIGAGLGMTTSTGRVSLIAPTVDIGRTGQELTVDGVRMVFQYTPGTEAPAEMNFYLPDLRALCTAENTSHTLHNIVTLRGAQVRDARAWADYLTETIDLFGADLDLVFASHHWPTWGRERAVEFLALQRDMYSYLHDQTLRMMNRGYIGAEIAELLAMPPALESAWHTRGYYGSVSHSVKAVYQRYMGWYDGNPAHLWPHPPVALAQRYVRAMGGAQAALRVAREAYDEGDYRWAAEVLDRIVFAGGGAGDGRDSAAPDVAVTGAVPADADVTGAAVALQADTLEQLGFGSENGTWRSVYLAAAHELRHGIFGTPVSSAGLAAALTVPQVFSSIAVRIDGPACWDRHVTLSWVFTDLGTTYVTELRNGTLIHRAAPEPIAGTTTITLTRPLLIGLVTQAVDVGAALADGRISVVGDPADLGAVFAAISADDPAFPIMTPRPGT